MTTATATEVFAPAKVNLTLHVTGQRADGYHLLDSLVVFADVGDRLTLTPGPALSIAVTGPFAAGVPADARNLVWRAAELAGWRGTIVLEKELPHGAGIGGGSSDAAALLRAVGFSGNALPLGADVPVCMRYSATRMRGIGDELTDIPQGPTWHAVLVNPGCHLPTPQVFRGLTQKTNPPMQDSPGSTSPPSDWQSWLHAQRNDLEPPAIELAPAIGSVLAALRAMQGCDLARMSGSGATCFGLFATAENAKNAAQALAATNPNWWCKATVLNPVRRVS